MRDERRSLIGLWHSDLTLLHACIGYLRFLCRASAVVVGGLIAQAASAQGNQVVAKGVTSTESPGAKRREEAQPQDADVERYMAGLDKDEDEFEC